MKRQPLQNTFFMLTPLVRDRLLETNLTAAEWRIWCYLVSLDPFGDRGAKFSPAKLMLKCGIKKTTYFAAKAKFQKLGLFDFKDGVTKVFNLQTQIERTSTSAHSQQAEFIESEISESESEISESESEISESESEISESESEISDVQVSKPLPDKASKELQTYSDFKDSLSESERENFLDFVKEKTKNLSQPINDIEAWLASTNKAGQNRWFVYHNNFLASLKLSGLDPQKPPIDNKSQQAVKRYEEELEQRKKAAQSAWEKRQKEQRCSNDGEDATSTKTLTNSSNVAAKATSTNTLSSESFAYSKFKKFQPRSSSYSKPSSKYLDEILGGEQ
jgi:hypothetical protein